MFDRQRSEPVRSSLCALCAALAVTGCSDTFVGPKPQSFSIQPQHQWAGGQVRVAATGGAFRVGDIITTGADTLAVLDQRTDRVSLPLPSSVNGPITLVVWRDAIRLGEVALEAYGYEETTEYPVRMDDLISVVPVSGGVSVAARSYDRRDCWGTDGGDFAWIYLSTGVHRTFRSAECVSGMFRVGVDPLVAELYYEYRAGTPEECVAYPCRLVHRGRLVAGELVDGGWAERPCNRWSCEPLAGDIWIVPDALLTCRVVQTPAGETCERISAGFGDDPQGIERLWSADVALSLGPVVAFRMSTGEEIYRLPSTFSYSGAPDESRGVFYLNSLLAEILTVRASDGTIERTHPISGVLALAYDAARDVLVLLLGREPTLEVRDPVSFALRGRISLPPEVRGSYPRVLVDDYTNRVFVVLSAASMYDEDRDEWRRDIGTPVISVRLPPL